MKNMYSMMTNADGDKLMRIFEGRTNNVTGPSCTPPKPYDPPSDEITSREG